MFDSCRCSFTANQMPGNKMLYFNCLNGVVLSKLSGYDATAVRALFSL